MESDGLVKKLLLTFAITVAAYIVIFHWIEGRRVAQGPWLVTFATDTNGQPSVVIAQEKRKIADLALVFPEQRLEKVGLRRTIDYSTVNTNTGFGQVIFQDSTFLPGTLTFNFFGHEIELLPRTLVIDQREYPWVAHDTIFVRGPGKSRMPGKTR